MTVLTSRLLRYAPRVLITDKLTFLRGRQRRVHRDRSMGAIDRTGAILPLPNRLPGDVVEPCQCCLEREEVRISSRIRWVVRAWLCRAWVMN